MNTALNTQLGRSQRSGFTVKKDEVEYLIKEALERFKQDFPEGSGVSVNFDPDFERENLVISIFVPFAELEKMRK